MKSKQKNKGKNLFWDTVKDIKNLTKGFSNEKEKKLFHAS